jgi:alpha-methylacyl-CoA racemase
MLDGIRILDLSRYLPGPACTWQLHGLGAQVDRVEPSRTGDPARHLPPMVNGTGALFASMSSGKRSLALDFRHPEARETLLSLASGYDVWVEGFRPGTLEAMGLHPAALFERNPGLILARISAYGQVGPWWNEPGHDLNFAGLSGITGAMAEPTVLPVQIADFAGAYVAATTICAALVERARTGRGKVLDIALSEAALAFMAPHVLAASVQGGDPKPAGELLNGGWPLYGVYRCSDGEYVTLAAVEPKFQAMLAEWTGGAVDRAALEQMFATAPRDVWVQRCGAACVAPVLRITEVGHHPAFSGRGAAEAAAGAMWVRPPLGRTVEEAVPSLGEHTDAILREAGYSEERLRELRTAGVVS